MTNEGKHNHEWAAPSRRAPGARSGVLPFAMVVALAGLILAGHYGLSGFGCTREAPVEVR